MRLLPIIQRVLFALAVIGLLVGPMGRPVMAMSPQDTAIAAAEETSHAETMAMADDMPCCPDEAPKSDCMKDCPLLALCLAKVFPASPGAAMPLTFVILSERMQPLEAFARDGLSQPPPARPPKA